MNLIYDGRIVVVANRKAPGIEISRIGLTVCFVIIIREG